MEDKQGGNRKVLYTATMHHNAKTVSRVAHMQYNNFVYKRRRITLLIGLALICAGAYIVRIHGGWGIFTLALGGFVLYYVDLVPRKVAKQATKNFAGKFPVIHAFVTDTGISSQQVTDEVDFSKLVKLIEDKNHIYIYVTEVTAFMLEKSSVDGEGGADGFKKFLSERSGLEWEKPRLL